MKRFFRLAPLLMLALILCGCGDSHQSLAREQVDTMKEMAATLDTVKDADSAKDAKPKLKKLAERMNDINQREAKLPAPTEAEIKAMDSKYGKEMEEASRKMQAAMLRIIADPKIGAELADIDL